MDQATSSKMFMFIVIFNCLAVLVSSQALSCTFENAIKNSTVLPCTCDGSACILEQTTLTDHLDWLAWQGTSPSSNTGPASDHTLGTAQGLYIYYEASKQSPGDRAMIRSQTLNLGQTSCLTFWYHMLGMHIGGLEVMATFSNGSTLTMWQVSGEQGDLWNEAAVPLDSTVIRIAMVGTKGGLDVGMPYGDIALDDILIERQLCPGYTNPPGFTTSTSGATTTTNARTTTRSPTTTSTSLTSMSHSSSTQAGTTSISASPTGTVYSSSTPSDSTSTLSTTPSIVEVSSTSETIEETHSTNSSDSSTELTTVSHTTTRRDPDRGSNATLWGLDETLWIIILVVAGAVILVLLVIVCVQACAMRRMRTARIVRQSDDYSNIEAYNRDPYERDPKGNNFINAYDNMGAEPDKPAGHPNGGGLI